MKNKKPILPITVKENRFTLDLSNLLTIDDINHEVSKSKDPEEGNLKHVKEMFVIYQITGDESSELVINHEKQQIEGDIRHLILLVILLSKRLKDSVRFDYECEKFWIDLGDTNYQN